jgi:hypothetical protein
VITFAASPFNVRLEPYISTAKRIRGQLQSPTCSPKLLQSHQKGATNVITCMSSLPNIVHLIIAFVIKEAMLHFRFIKIILANGMRHEDGRCGAVPPF